MTENEIADIILDCAFEIHRELGPGLLESVYEKAMEVELLEHKLEVKRQFAIPFRYKKLLFDEGFRADLLVNDKVLVELKSVRTIEAVFLKQVLTYLKLSKRRLGILINFNEVMLKNGIRRVANDLVE